MSIIYKKSASRPLVLEEREEPQLYREIYPYSKVGRIEFDDVTIPPRPANPFFITDTTFRDGQQARPPYTVKQIARMYDLLHKLGGKSGLIQASEFFMYSQKDRKAIETCRARGYRFPRITGWIRANIDDLKIARDMEFDEVGMLTSVSDYHLYLKLGKNRQTAMNDYLKLVEQALSWGIVPRCHFEDITRADIYGFCLPFAGKLMELSKQASMPVKIRLCDTMGFGVPYSGAALPRSVQRIVRAFTDEAGVPGEWLEWHGHNDFHKVLVNSVTAWLYGCGAVNGALLGFGERTGNTPIEALVIEYISLTGKDEAADTTVISEIAEFFESELGYKIPPNYPFVGAEFNATAAGVHHHFKLEGDSKTNKQHPAIGKIYADIMKAYEEGRNTSFSTQEMLVLAKRYFPELFVTELQKIKRLAGRLAAHLVTKLAGVCVAESGNEETINAMKLFVKQYPFIQFLTLNNIKGELLEAVITDPSYQEKYGNLPKKGYDYSDREWFKAPVSTGKLHISDLYQSQYTGKLIITVAMAVTTDNDDITGVVSADIQLEEILIREAELEAAEQAENIEE